MHFFFACHWESKNDRAKERESLDKALEIDVPDIEAVIAAYHLPDQPAEYRAKILALIRQATERFEDKIAAYPQDQESYNQYAWLVGNTEGDLDRALKCAEKAVELKPNSGDVLDTLARVHFARGDLDGAVTLQTKAAELDPYTGAIQRQLQFFRKQAEEKKKP